MKEKVPTKIKEEQYIPDTAEQKKLSRIKFLESKQKLSPAEQAELTARRETGDDRIAFLESKRASGKKLSPAEQAELTARRETGDGRIAFLESKRASGKKLSPAEQAELTARREIFQKKK